MSASDPADRVSQVLLKVLRKVLAWCWSGRNEPRDLRWGGVEKVLCGQWEGGRVVVVGEGVGRGGT